MFRKLATLALLVVVAVNAYDAGQWVVHPSAWSFIGLHSAAYLAASFAALLFTVRRVTSWSV